MNTRRFSITMVCLGLSACGGAAPPAPQKSDGPAINTLSVKQLEEVNTGCRKYSDPNDPRGVYSAAYCSQAQSAWSMRDYAKPSTAPVNPNLDALH